MGLGRAETTALAGRSLIRLPTSFMNEVHKDFDTLFLDFIEENGIQLWPNRNSTGTAIVSWTAQCPKPFMQTTKQNLKATIVKLMFKMEELRFDDNTH